MALIPTWLPQLEKNTDYSYRAVFHDTYSVYDVTGRLGTEDEATILYAWT